MKIIQNVLGYQSFNYIKNQIIDTQTFPWYIGETTYPSNEQSSIFHTNWVHMALVDGKITSDVYNVIYPIILNIFDNLNEHINTVLRVRFALQTSIGKQFINDAHVDCSYEHKTAIFYIKNSDGNTIIYNEKYDTTSGLNTETYRQKILNNQLTVNTEVSPVENTIVLFDGLTYHASQKPINASNRIVLNINYT